jgi:hypothetical protein
MLARWIEGAEADEMDAFLATLLKSPSPVRLLPLTFAEVVHFSIAEVLPTMTGKHKKRAAPNPSNSARTGKCSGGDTRESDERVRSNLSKCAFALSLGKSNKVRPIKGQSNYECIKAGGSILDMWKAYEKEAAQEGVAPNITITGDLTGDLRKLAVTIVSKFGQERVRGCGEPWEYMRGESEHWSDRLASRRASPTPTTATAPPPIPVLECEPVSVSRQLLDELVSEPNEKRRKILVDQLSCPTANVVQCTGRSLGACTSLSKGDQCLVAYRHDADERPKSPMEAVSSSWS